MKVYRDFNICIDEKEITRLLGYGNDVPDDEILQAIRDEIKKCMDYIEPQLVYEKVNIRSIEGGRVLLDNSVELEGQYIRKKLEKCSSAAVTAATLGNKIDGVINEAFESGDYLKGMIVDAIGTTAIEYVNKSFWNVLLEGLKEGEGITCRLSPGSNGWDISGQKAVFKCIDAALIGIKMTDTFMMTPVKSTTIVYGFGEGIGIAREEHVCSQCGLKNCRYRADRKVQIKVTTEENDCITMDVVRGSNLMDLLNNEGILTHGVCGGKGTCGKCRVKFLSGAPAPSGEDAKFFSDDELKSGMRLACMHEIEGPAQIQIAGKPDSMEILTSGEDIDVTSDPPVFKRFLKLGAPSINDQRGDFRRIRDGLNMDSVDIDYGVIGGIPEVLRSEEYKVTPVIFKNKIIGIEKGDTSGLFYGAAVDIGTTTIACYLVDMNTGKTVDIESGINAQRAYGADVISRINYTIENENGSSMLKNAVVGQINEMLNKLCFRNNIDIANVYSMAVAGNTTMIHLFLGLPCKNIAMSPYIPVTVESLDLKAREIGMGINGIVSVMPGVASYVGSDITAGMLSCGMFKSGVFSLLLDLGTNGEIALGNSEGASACAAAAGPAFEGANIKCGIGGVKGAISVVDLSKNKIYKTIGNSAPCGICGSGVLDTVSEFIKYGIIDETGRIPDVDEIDCPESLKKRIIVDGGMKEFLLDEENKIVFTQKDVREVQLAKAAVSAGVEILISESGIGYEDIGNVYIAGGFGNFMNIDSALRIGLIPKALRGKVKSIGNAAGTGARMYLLSKSCRHDAEKIASKTSYIELSGRPDFQDRFVDLISFGG